MSGSRWNIAHKLGNIHKIIQSDNVSSSFIESSHNYAWLRHLYHFSSDDSKGAGVVGGGNGGGDRGGRGLTLVAFLVAAAVEVVSIDGDNAIC